jgi:5-(carboxyamino)imidazole ribonucleotide synthase
MIDKSNDFQKKSGNSRVFGILGGGQLSLMLGSAAVKMGICFRILAENEFAPAVQICPSAILGSLRDPKVLETFFSQVDFVLFENEFVDTDLCREISLFSKVCFLPSLEAISLFQDKIQQKELFQSCGIPTADYFILDEKKSFEIQLCEAFERFGGSFVLKWSKMGYDGKGVVFVTDFSKKRDVLESFCQKAWNQKNRVYVEKAISFRRELAVIGVHSIKNSFLTYPLVISEQKKGICHRVKGPAVALGVPLHLEACAHAYAEKISTLGKLIGSFAVEFFETQEGELYVNEVAPRVHNTGHYTQNACATDQFENHWRGILGYPLGAPSSMPAFAMLNLLGPEFSEREWKGTLPRPGVNSHLHWYGKKEIHPGRKLGHLNGVLNELPNPSPHSDQDRCKQVDFLIKELEESHQKWLEDLENLENP